MGFLCQTTGKRETVQDNRLLNTTMDVQNSLCQAYCQQITNEYNSICIGGGWNPKIIEENPEVHNLL